MPLNNGEFMRRVLAWPDDNDKGFINVHYAGKSDGRPWMSGRPTRTLQQFMQKVYEANSWKTPVDLYMCMSRQGRTRDGKDGKVLAAKTHADALALKAIWLDVDVGKEKGFQTRDEAMGGLLKFFAAVNIPPPSAVVASGGGLHVYLINKTPLKPAEWQFWADALKTLGLKHLGGDFFDAMCTSDSVRILRVPGTWNRKLETPRAVELLELQENDYDFDTDLATLKTVDTERSRIIVPAADDLLGQPDARFANANFSLGGGIEAEKWIVNLDYVAPQCGFVREALETGGAAFGQPLWNLTNLLATFSTGGREDAHRMARGYPRYSPAETDIQFDRKLEERRNPRLGPPGCAAIQAAGCTSCASCPLLALGKSPPHHVRIPMAEPVSMENVDRVPENVEAGTPRTIPPRFTGVVSPTRRLDAPPSLMDADLPAGYILRDDTPYLRKVVTDKKSGDQDVQDIQLLKCRIYEPWTQKEGDRQHALNFSVSVDAGHYKQCSMTMEQMEAGSINRELLKQSVATYQDHKQHLGKFFMDWLAKLHEAEASREATQLGWIIDPKTNVPSGFAYGGTFYGVDGSKTKSGITDRYIHNVYTPRGDIAVWFEACKSITDQNRPEIEVLVAAGFASPLMILTGQYNGMLAAISSESGVFKTSAARTALAIWANPKLATETPASTLKGSTNRAGQIRNLPILWDELTETENLRMVHEALFIGTLGVEGSRLTSDIKQQERKEWQLLSTVCSNNSFADYVATKNPSTAAGLMRVLEWRPQPLPEDSPARISQIDAQKLYTSLDYNFGRVGELYVDLIVNNFAATEKLVEDLSRQTQTDLKLKDGERFWGAMIAAILAGATIAKELGCEFHLDGLRQHLYDTVEDNRKRVREEIHTQSGPERVNDVLTGFLKAMVPNTLVTMRDGVSQHKVAHPNRDVACEVQWDDPSSTLRFSKATFRKWVAQPGDKGGPGWNPRQATKALEAIFKATVVRSILARGTQWRNNQEDLIVIDLKNNPGLMAMMKAMVSPADEQPEDIPNGDAT